MIVLMEGDYNGRIYPFAVFSTKKLATKTLRELGYKYSKFDECFINDKSRKYVHMESFVLDKMPPMLESPIEFKNGNCLVDTNEPIKLSVLLSL